MFGKWKSEGNPKFQNEFKLFVQKFKNIFVKAFQGFSKTGLVFQIPKLQISDSQFSETLKYDQILILF